MNEDYQIVQAEKPEWSIIGGGINQYNTAKAGADHGQTLCFVLKAPDEEVVGGVIAATHWEWLHIDLMWLKEEFRGQGYGQRLLEMAEAEARQRGARHAYLDTFSFQAPDFYKKFGYRVFGTLADFPAGHQRFFMSKAL